MGESINISVQQPNELNISVQEGSPIGVSASSSNTVQQSIAPLNIVQIAPEQTGHINLFTSPYCAGNFVAYSEFISTGQYLSNYILEVSGNLYSLIQTSVAGVSTLNGLSGIIDLIGTGNISIVTGDNNTIIISGAGGTISGSSLSQNTDFGTYSIPTGCGPFTFSYNKVFTQIPSVVTSLVNDSGEDIFAYNLSGITKSGFSIYPTEDVESSYYKINYIAIEEQGSGSFATNQDLYNTGQYLQSQIDSISVSGGSGVSEAFVTGISGFLQNQIDLDKIGFNIYKSGDYITGILYLDGRVTHILYSGSSITGVNYGSYFKEVLYNSSGDITGVRYS